MSSKTAIQTCQKIRTHLNKFDKKKLVIIFHGGEPLLGGLEHIKVLVDIIDMELRDKGFSVTIGIQTNGLLLNQKIIDFAKNRGIQIGISIDGPPHINDLHRVDHMGRGSSFVLEEKLRLIMLPKNQKAFGGFLTVVNISTNPTEVYDYLASFPVPKFDLLLPYDNHDRYPPGKSRDETNTLYSNWLKVVFDLWVADPRKVKIRFFESVVRTILGGTSLVESIGEDPFNIIVLETNGEIEAVDSLKAACNGVSKLGLSIFNNEFDEAYEKLEMQYQPHGVFEISDICKKCNIYSSCGSGYIPTRYSRKNGFNNPSVYCEDLYDFLSYTKKYLVNYISENIAN